MYLSKLPVRYWIVSIYIHAKILRFTTTFQKESENEMKSLLIEAVEQETI